MDNFLYNCYQNIDFCYRGKLVAQGFIGLHRIDRQYTIFTFNSVYIMVHSRCY